MNDDLTPLRESPELHDLLTHYARLAGPDRQVWQDRRMEQDGCDPRMLSRLHGRLIAQGWVEQNTAGLTTGRAGAVPNSYRVTPAGLRALKAAERDEDEE